MAASGRYYYHFYLHSRTPKARSGAFESRPRPKSTMLLIPRLTRELTMPWPSAAKRPTAPSLWLHDWELDQLEYDRSLNYCSAERVREDSVEKVGVTPVPDGSGRHP